MAKVSIITIGDELLIGQVMDTNSGWMATELNNAGIAVIRRVAVGDDALQIKMALDQESKLADAVLITGGLGPTADDITKPLLCDYFGGKMIRNQEVLNHIEYLFKEIHQRPITERNRKQADVPDNCQVIRNERGTAPGMWFERDGKIFVSMPGVPQEMMGIMQLVIPMLKKQLQVEPIYHRTLVTSGIGESSLADLIADFESALPPHFKLAYLPRYGMVRLRLTVRGSSNVLENELDHHFNQLKEKIIPYLVTDKDESMEAVIGRLLKVRNKTVSTAESCTGGYISRLISSIPGASAYYEGSFVTYSYYSKENLLDVPKETLNNKGAVSEEVVRQMAKSSMEKLRTDYSIAVSGIMGPGGGTAEKPTGTVWIAIGSRSQISTHCYQFKYDRQRNIELTALQALNLLRKRILEEDS